MNVLQVVPDLDIGGVERTTIEIAQALKAAGHTAHIVSNGGRMETALAEANGVLHRLNIGSKNPLALRVNTKTLIDLVKAHKIDILHARSRAPAWPARAAARATNIPFITTYHGIYNAKSRLKRRYNSIMVGGDAVIANSEFTKNHIIKTHGTNPDKITVIPRGVDIYHFDPARVKKADICRVRAAWGVNGTLPIVLLPGRLTQWKGQLLAVEMAALLRDSGIDIDLVLQGDVQGRERYIAEIETWVQAHDLTERVHVAAHSDNMANSYAASDLVIVPSTVPEAFGRVAAEAQAMEKPVVASDHGGVRETMVNRESGFLVTPGSADALADGIASVLAIPASERRKLGRPARAHIVRNFSIQSLKNATLALYRRALVQKINNSA